MKSWKCIDCGKTFTTANDAQPFPMTCNECRAANKPDFSQFKRTSTPGSGGPVSGGAIGPPTPTFPPTPGPRPSPPQGRPTSPGRGTRPPTPMPYGTARDGDPLPLPSAPSNEQKVHTSSVTQMMRRTPTRTNLPVTPAAPPASHEPPPSGRRRSTSVVGGIAAEAEQRAHDRSERARAGKGTNRSVLFMLIGATVLMFGVGGIILMNMGSAQPPKNTGGLPTTPPAPTPRPLPPTGTTKTPAPGGVTPPTGTLPPGPPVATGPKLLTPYEEDQLKRKEHPELFPPTPPTPPNGPLAPTGRPTERGELVVHLDAANSTEGGGTWSRTTFSTEAGSSLWSWTALKADDQYPFFHFDAPQDFGPAAYIRIRYRVSGWTKPDISVVVNDDSPELNVWRLPVQAGTQNQWVETEQKVTGLIGKIPELEFRPSGDAEIGMTIAVDWVEVYKAREIVAVQPTPAPAPVPVPTGAPRTRAVPNPANKVAVLPPAAPATPVDAAQNDAMVAAVEKGDLATVKRFVEANPGNLKVLDKNGYTPMHAAARRGNLDMLKYLLSAGMAVDTLQKFGRTPLQQACEFGQLAALQLLFDNGANLDRLDDENRPPIYFAVRNDHPVIIQEMMRLGANPNIADRSAQQTPLHFAALKGSKLVITALLAGGADPNLKDKNGKLPLDLAIAGNFTDAIQLLSKPAPAPAPAPTPPSGPAVPAGKEIIHLHGSAADEANGAWNRVKIDTEEGDTTFVNWVRPGENETPYPQFELKNDPKFNIGAKVKVKIRLRTSAVTAPVSIKLFCRRAGVSDQTYGSTEQALPQGPVQWQVIEVTIAGTPGQLQVIELRTRAGGTGAGSRIDIDSVDVTAVE